MQHITVIHMATDIKTFYGTVHLYKEPWCNIESGDESCTDYTIVCAHQPPLYLGNQLV